MIEAEGDSDWDARTEADKMGSATRLWQIGAEVKLSIPSGEEADFRTAADTSQSAFDAAVANSGLSSAVKSFYSGLPAPVKATLREAAKVLP